MKFRLLFIALLISTLSFSKNEGKIIGVLTDKHLNQKTLPSAKVIIREANISTNTDANGKFSIVIQPGVYIVEFSLAGYESTEVIVTVNEGETTITNESLIPTNYNLKEVVIRTKSSREKETAILLEQKNAVEIKQAIGAEELSRKGVGDVATAVTKVTGISKQEGSGNIFVRGLGDRYNSTTMNGLPVPSNDPEKKNINLEIFSTDIVEYISIDKVYSSKLYGDFSGGNVDIVSKDYSGNGFLKLDIKSKVNTNALSENNFNLQKGVGNFGFTNISIPNNPLNQYNFNTLQLEGKSPVGTSFGLSGGNSFRVGNVGKINFFSTFSHDNEYTSKSDGTAKGGVNGTGVANKNFDSYTSLNFNTNTTAMANIGYKINHNNKINFNTVFVNTSTQSKEDYTGYIVDVANDGNGLIRRTTYTKNSLWINQLLGENKLSDRSKLNWGLSYNTIQGNMPDRVQNTFRKQTDGYTLYPDNNRYFQKLNEDEAAINTSFDYKFRKIEDGLYKGKITFGFSSRYKTRDFEATQFSLKTASNHINTIVDPENLDLFYNQQNLDAGYFNISTFRGGSQVSNALDPQTYNGEQSINAGFVNTEYKSNKLTTVLGLRGEYILQKIKWNTQLDPSGGKDELDKYAFLPSLTLKYELNDKQNLRLGFSKTYTLPQFKERALFLYEEVTEVKIGNPHLYASDDYNIDLKWEMFPKSEELISVTAFGKYIQNPMNEVTIASSTNDISYVNTGDYGYVTGAEVEYRKLLFDFESKNPKKLSAGINASYLYSNQELNSEKVIKETDYNVVFTNSKSKFTGASDLLLNADISFLNKWNDNKNNLTTTLAYSYYSDRVYAIGTSDRGNLIDKAFSSLDFIAKSKLNKNIGIGFVAKNLLNPTLNRVQENSNGDINVLSYKKGLTLSLNLNYQF